MWDVNADAVSALFSCRRVPIAPTAARIVAYLLEHPGGATVTELAGAVGITHSVIRRAVNVLESLGIVETSLVTTTPGPGRRAKRVVLRPPGVRRLVEECFGELDALEKRLGWRW